MKLTAVLLLGLCLQLSARSYSQNLTLSVKNAALEKVFAAIQKQSGYSFYYKMEILSKAQPVTIDVKNASLDQVLTLVFKNQPFNYTIVDKNIGVKEKESEKKGAAANVTMLEPPPSTVHGRVINEKGEPVAGANISIKGGKVIAVTDDNGEFVLNNVQDDVTLVFTAVNIETVEIKVNARKELNVHAKIKVEKLADIEVSKGYYSVKQKLNTGNVNRISGTDIQSQPITDAVKALEGLVPGLNVQQNNGYPGSDLNKIEIRGRNSLLGGRTPLIIVDGIPLPYNSLSAAANIYSAAGAMSLYNGLNSDNIESIEILKDADATAIYGTRGANGVILITTKKGKAGKTELNLNFCRGFGAVSKYPELMNTQQYLQMRHEAFNNDGAIPQPWDYDINGTWDTTRSTNWAKKLIGGTANTTKINASITGGNSTTQFSISGAFTKQTTVLPGDFFDQVGSGHFSLNHKSNNNKLQLSFQADYSTVHNQMPVNDITLSIPFIAPDAPQLYLPDGKYNWENGTWDNPAALLKQTSTANSTSLLTSLNTSYKIFDGLSLRTIIGYNSMSMNAYNLFPLVSWNPSWATANDRQSVYGESRSNTWIAEPQIGYNFEKNKHNFSFLAGMTFQDNVTNSSQITGTGFTTDELIRNIAFASTKNVNFISNSEYKLNKLYGRLGYNYDEKYIVNLTGSREGSSRFGPSNQYANFGAIGVGYVFTKENSVQKAVPFLTYGKVRASYGSSGNDQISDYKYLDTYSGTSVTYQGLAGLNPTGLYNPYYRWESVRKLEFGLELGFLHDRISFEGSYFRNRTNNQLIGYVLPVMTGFNNIIANFPAIIDNNGFEFVITTKNIVTKSLQWSTSLNLTIPKNRLTSFPGIESSSYNRSYAIGRSLGVRYVYHYTGLNSQTGVYTFQDINGDGNIDYPNDYGFFAEARQKFYGGLQSHLSYKNWQFNLLFQFVSKTASNYYSEFGMPGGFMMNQPVSVLSSRWQKAGDNPSSQRFSQDWGSAAASAYYNRQSSDAVITDASFVRLKNLSLMYTIKQKQFQYLSIYAEGQNLFTISNYLGADPETASTTALPLLRVLAVGIKLGL